MDMKLEMKNDVLILEAVIPCSYIKSSIFGVGRGGREGGMRGLVV